MRVIPQLLFPPSPMSHKLLTLNSGTHEMGCPSPRPPFSPPQRRSRLCLLGKEEPTDTVDQVCVYTQPHQPFAGRYRHEPVTQSSTSSSVWHRHRVCSELTSTRQHHQQFAEAIVISGRCKPVAQSGLEACQLLLLLWLDDTQLTLNHKKTTLPQQATAGTAGHSIHSPTQHNRTRPGMALHNTVCSAQHSMASQWCVV